MIERTVREEIQNLRDHQWIVHHERMSRRQHDVVGHAVEPRALDRDEPVIGPVEYAGHRRQRTIAGDDPDLEIGRAKPVGKARRHRDRAAGRQGR